MKFDDIKKLHQKKYREQFGHFLLEGEHLILELQKALVTNPQLATSEIYFTEKYSNWFMPIKMPLKTHLINERQMAQLNATKTPQGIVAVVPLLKSNNSPSNKNERAIYLHEIQDPGNLGTILRTLAWFGNFRCLLSSNSVDPYNDKAVRASMGAIFHVPLEIDVAFDVLPQRFQRIAYLDMQGKTIRDAAFKTCDCYVFGNEARGLPREQIANESFTIGGEGNIESLNLAAAVNICVYEIQR